MKKPNFAPSAVRDIALNFIMLKEDRRVLDFKTFALNHGGFLKADYIAILREARRLSAARYKSGIGRTAQDGING